jgi:adenylyltransferase/sulfurtransferase
MNGPHPTDPEADFRRYRRQARFLGADSSRQLASASAAIVGIGAVGGMTADLLTRAGVGELRLIDRDLVERHNLHRQTLFDESDAAEESPKAEAAARRLGRINSEVRLVPTVAELGAGNIVELLAGSDLILDGSDNFATRFLLNDYCVREGLPWISAGCLGAAGQVLTVIPSQTPCLRCLLPDCPPVGATPTCETAGVIGPAIAVVAGLQATEALKVLTGKRNALRTGVLSFDVWRNAWRTVGSDAKPDPACLCCGDRRFEFLDAAPMESLVRRCGQSVQIAPLGGSYDLTALAERLHPLGDVSLQRFLLKFRNPDASLTIFRDGRTIVHGVDDLGRARAIFDRYLGR